MDLVKAARKGEEAAFLELFDAHHAPLFRFAYRMTRSVADAEDIVQDCFLSLLRPGAGYDAGRGPLRTYLFGVVRKQALRRLRTRESSSQSAPEGVEHRSPESEALQAEMTGVVGRAVGELPETQREVLILAHYEHLSLAEIGEVMGLDVGAVKSRLQRARASLRETLAAYATKTE
jgi:RNA polymerase sigma-70 factor (ECF subfamily)